MVVEHVDKSAEGLDDSISAGVDKFKLVKDQNELHIFCLLEHSIQEVRNTHDSDVIPAVLIARHIDECGLIIEMIDVGGEGHRSHRAAKLGLVSVAFDHHFKEYVCPALILNSFHGQPPNPIEGSGLTRTRHAHQDDAVFLDLQDPAVTTLQHCEEVGVILCRLSSFIHFIIYT